MQLRLAAPQLYSTVETIEHEDLGDLVVVGAVLVAGAPQRQVVSREMVPRLRPGSVLVGTSRSTRAAASDQPATSTPRRHTSSTA